ncbi:hypothetical protein DAI22_08g106300 [Oryza sativa Japonica Group]|nr:hypothetical protein DAI22_08g106300 [Oryza sativa Japonica Group]
MPSSLALPAASSSPSLPCYDGSRPEPRRAATARAPMPLAGSGKLVGEREKEPGETAAAAAAESRGNCELSNICPTFIREGTPKGLKTISTGVPSCK